MADRTVEVLIEIARGSRSKYELDERTGRLRLDRVLYSSVHYPTDHGLIVDEYVRAQHSHSSLARRRIGQDRAREFDEKVRAIVMLGADRAVHRHVECEIVWGRPLAP